MSEARTLAPSVPARERLAATRARSSTLKVPDEVLHLAEALKREDPARTVAHICELLAASCGWAPGERTIQRHFHRIGLTRQSLAGGCRAFWRFDEPPQ